MKGQHCYTLMFLFLLYACQEDFIQPTDMYSGDALLKESITRREPCIDLLTTYTLYATGQFVYVQVAAPAKGQSGQPAGYYQIEAHGDAISKQYARGITDLSMRYDPVTNTILADMHTDFYFGQSMEVHIEGPVDVRDDGQSTYLSAEIDAGTFWSGEMEYALSAGSILFALPMTPTGNFILGATENSTFCIE